MYIYIYTHTSNDYTKIGKVVTVLNLSNYNLSKKLILPVTKIAEAISYKWLLWKQIQKEDIILTTTRWITQSGSKLIFGLLKK